MPTLSALITVFAQLGVFLVVGAHCAQEPRLRGLDRPARAAMARGLGAGGANTKGTHAGR